MAVERSGHVWLRSVVMIVYLIGSEGFFFLRGALCDYLKLPVTRILLRTNQNLFLSFSSKFDSQF